MPNRVKERPTRSDRSITGLRYCKKGVMKRKNLLRLVLLLFVIAVVNGGIFCSVPSVSAALTLQSASATTTSLTLVFNEPVRVDNAIGSVQQSVTLTDPSGTPVAITYSSGTQTVIFTTTLTALVTYTVHINGLAAAPPSTDTLSTTAAVTPTVVVGLAVISTVPANAATNVVPNIRPSATFSESVTLPSVTTAFTLSSSLGPVSGTVALDSTGTVATFTPAESLLTDTTYTATIAGGASGVQATNGDMLSGSTEWTFTTGSSDFQTSGTSCFIATAAFGSYLDPHVRALRDFRDKYLLTNALGRAFVSLYYKNSPPVAAYISRHETLRAATRWALTPLIYVAAYPFSLALFAVFGIVLVVRRRRR
jgi:hypothetical protein